jgi:hypothetical protein
LLALLEANKKAEDSQRICTAHGELCVRGGRRIVGDDLWIAPKYVSLQSQTVRTLQTLLHQGGWRGSFQAGRAGNVAQEQQHERHVHNNLGYEFISRIKNGNQAFKHSKGLVVVN